VQSQSPPQGGFFIFMDTQAIIALTKKLMAVQSVTTNHEKLHEVIAIVKKELAGFHIQEFESNGVPSLVVSNGTETKHFQILLNAHIDVVPANTEGFRIYEEDGRLYGRGGYDMKAATAVMIFLFKELAKRVPYSLGLQIVTDEEIGGYDGTIHQIYQGIRGDFIITGEPTNLEIRNKAKGILNLAVTAKGVSAHGGYPWRGENAIMKMQEFLAKLHQQLPTPEGPEWRTTANVAQIRTTNTTFNKVPADCTAQIDIRYIPEERETILPKMQKMLTEDFSLEVLFFVPAMLTSEKNFYVSLLQKVSKKSLGKALPFGVAHAASDMRSFQEVGCPGIEFGLDGHNHHSDDEYITLSSITRYYEVLREFLLQIKKRDTIVEFKQATLQAPLP
jgi:succinyl-diaminopimelate desuccinylase